MGSNKIGTAVLDIRTDMASVGTGLDAGKAKVKDFTTAFNAAKREASDFSAQMRRTSQLVNEFSGQKAIQEAHAVAKAVEAIGGASKLSAEQQKQTSAVMEAALAAHKARGDEAATSVQKLAAATKQADDSSGGLAAKLGLTNTQLSASVIGFASALSVVSLASSAFRILSDFVSSSVESFSSAEAASVRLTQALRAQSTFSPELKRQYDDLATQFQKTTAFSDDMVTSMQAVLVQVGDVMPSQMDRALRASTDLAAGLGIDLETATNLVAKAASGHTETLGRYGITVSKAALETQGFSAVLAAVESHFGGQATAQLDTYAGRVAQLGNAWDNVKEAVGRKLLLDPLVLAGVERLTNASDSQSGSLDTASKSAGDYAATALRMGSAVVGLVPGFEGTSGAMRGLASAIEQAEMDAASFVARMAAIRRGADDWKKFVASAGMSDTSTPRIMAAGMAEAEAQAKRDEETKKRAAKAAEEATAEYDAWAQATRDVMQSAQGFDKVLAGIDGRVVEAVKSYREQGVSLERLGKMYQLSPVQVEAFAASEQAAAEAARQETEALHLQVKAMREVDAAMAKGLKTLPKGAGEILNEPPQRQIIDPELLKKLNQAKPIASAFTREFDAIVSHDIPAILQRAFEGGGGVMGAVKSLAAKIGGMIGGSDTVAGWSKGITDKLASGLHIGGEKAKSVLSSIVSGGLQVGIDAAMQLAVAGMQKLWSKLTKSVEKHTNDIRDVAFASAGGFSALAQKAVDAGTTIKAALDAKTPEAFKKAMDDLTAAFEFQDQALKFLDSTLEKYGFQISDLSGPAAARAIANEAAQLFKELEALAAGGLSTATIIGNEKIDEAMQKLVTDAMKTGQALPESMRPWIQAMIDAGKLIDANGDKITDIGQLTFEENQSAQWKDLTQAVKDLTDAITRGLSAAIRSIPDPVVTGRVKWNVDDIPNAPDSSGLWDTSGLTGADVIPMADGGFGRVHRPTLFSSKGNEDFAFSGEGRRFAGGGNAADQFGLQSELSGLNAYLRGQHSREIARAVRDEVQKVSWGRA